MSAFSVDTELCVQCGECAADCPPRCIELEPEFPRLVPGKEDTCVECQHCMTICPTGAVSVLGLDPKDSTELEGAYPETEALLTLMKGRRSCRRYKREAVDEAAMGVLYEALAHAPTGVNSRTLLFTVINEPDTMDAVRAEAYAQLQAAAEAGTLPAGREHLANFLGPWEKGVDILFRGASCMLVVTVHKDAPCPEADPFIAMSYFELAANAMGLGTVWCGLGKYAIFDVPPGLRRRLGIPEDHAPGYCMLFGVPDNRYYRTAQREPRLNLVRD